MSKALQSKAYDELKAIAGRKRIAVPTSPDAKHNALKSKLESLKGSAFDRAFVDAMLVSRHSRRKHRAAAIPI